MLIDRANWRLHALPAGTALLLSLVLIGWYAVGSWARGSWLGGGSLPGLVLGGVAAMIILFEMALWPRKLLRRMRLFPARYWMSAHIWFGLACLPIAIAHSGLHWGGWLTTLLMGLLIATVVSGAVGLTLQNIIPKWMLHQIPAETIHSQIDQVSATLVEELNQALTNFCGPRETADESTQDAAVQDAAVQDDTRRLAEKAASRGDGEATRSRIIVIGASRATPRRERYTADVANVSSADDASALWNAFDELRPFLLDGTTQTHVFGDPARAANWFRLLRRACTADAEAVIGPLERLAAQRRQFNLQQRMTVWLHGWLPVHIGVSVGLSVLLVAHIVFALRFW